jgi:hypothetical protein
VKRLDGWIGRIEILQIIHSRRIIIRFSRHRMFLQNIVKPGSFGATIFINGEYKKCAKNKMS